MDVAVRRISLTQSNDNRFVCKEIEFTTVKKITKKAPVTANSFKFGPYAQKNYNMPLNFEHLYIFSPVHSAPTFQVVLDYL